jgi:hypothetical protein
MHHSVIHATHAIRACRARRQKRRNPKSHLMYISETGQAVYVLPKTKRLSKLKQKKKEKRSERLPPTIPPPPPPPHPQPPPISRDVNTLSPQQTRISEEDIPPPPPPKEPQRNHSFNSTPDSSPINHVPDEAELERRRKGDAQPQLIWPDDPGMKFSATVSGTAPDVHDGKILRKPLTGNSRALGSASNSPVDAIQQDGQFGNRRW